LLFLQDIYQKKFLKVVTLTLASKRYFEIEQSLPGFLKTTVRENPNEKEEANTFGVMLNGKTREGSIDP